MSPALLTETQPAAGAPSRPSNRIVRLYRSSSLISPSDVRVTGAPVTITVDGVSSTVGVGGSSAVAAWDFVGFTQPIDAIPTLNRAKAGQAIPVKWRILDSAGHPVTNLTSARLVAVNLACNSNATVDQIEETVATESGLKSLGNGNYQINWKSPTSYANSCKTLRLDIGDGVTHDARFQFTK